MVFFRFHIGGLKTVIGHRIDARFEFRRLFNQDGRKFRICGGLGELEKRRRLTHEIQPAYHDVFPVRPIK